MLEFAGALPHIRDRIDEDMGKRGMPREKVLATMVSLLDRTLICVGNGEYAKENGSYGLTTLRTRHLGVNGTE
jgi:DNA topoisomerase I